MIRALAMLLAFASPAMAQEVTLGEGVILRALDKVTGDVSDLELPQGTSINYGRLQITTGECRFPTGNPAGDAYAFLQIRDNLADDVMFEGWMIASAPALNALDHARYDVWVLRCKTSDA